MSFERPAASHQPETASSKEGELTIERKLEQAHATRERILDRLMHLEDLRRVQRMVPAGDIQTLRDIIEGGKLTSSAQAEAMNFLQHEGELRDAAATMIVFLQQTNDIIGEFERQAGFSEEELEARRVNRDRHFATHQAEWEG